jgi:hypothetical protein
LGEKKFPVAGSPVCLVAGLQRGHTDGEDSNVNRSTDNTGCIEMPSAKKQASQAKRHLQLLENEPDKVESTKVKKARPAKAVSKTQRHTHKAGEECRHCAAEEADFLAAMEKLKALQALHKQRKRERDTVETPLVREEIKGDIKEYFPAENVSKKAVATVFTILALAAGMVLWNILKPREAASVLTKELTGHHFSAADEKSGLEFFDNHIVFDNKGQVPTVALSHIWVGDWTDELKLLSGQFDNAHTRWMQVSGDTITINEKANCMLRVLLNKSLPVKCAACVMLLPPITTSRDHILRPLVF